MTTRYPTKDIAESVVIAFDFSAEAASVTGPTVTAEVEFTGVGDALPSAILDGAPEIDPASPAVVLQRVEGGVDVTDYALRCTATADTGDVLTVAAVLPVRRLP